MKQSPVKPSQFTRTVSLNSILGFRKLSRDKWPRRARVFSVFLSSLEFSRCSRGRWPRWGRVPRFSRVFSVFSSFLEPSGLSGLEFLGFGRLAADMGKRGSRTLIWSILGVWRQIWAKVTPEGSFRQFWEPGREYGQKATQKAHLEHFGSLAADMGKRGPRSRVASVGSSFLGFLEFSRCFRAFSSVFARHSGFEGGFLGFL